MQARLQTKHPALVFKDFCQILIKYIMADAEVAEVVRREIGYGVEWEVREMFNTGRRVTNYYYLYASFC